jgi:hypothetical protein
MPKNLSRRAALAGAAALVPAAATIAAAAAGEDPFFQALAEYRAANAIWDASFYRDGPHPRSGYDDYIGECNEDAHEALLAALTTAAGWAALLEFLAADPYGAVPDGSEDPLCAHARVGYDDEWRDAICGALRAAAEVLRNSAPVRT